MDIAEVEESLFAVSDAKLHGEMCKSLSSVYCRVLNIFPALEAARPRSRSGIQALCSLHIALEKAKTLLQHCSECSKLYLAITGDSILLKFERVKCSLMDSLKRFEDIVPEPIGCQVLEIVNELDSIVIALDPSEKQVGEEMITLLQQGRSFDENSSYDNEELECFHQAASKLGINSSRAALAERRALKKLIERARGEEDKRKEAIVAYLLHLMRKYSKLFRSDLTTEDNDSQGSTPCSPTVQGSLGSADSGQCFVRLSSFNFKPSLTFKPNEKRSGQLPIPPEELKCPISLQLMYDPVIIASGQTYERVCIEKWFSDGHNTCPKSLQQLSHLGLTPNYCVKGLIASWCEQHGFPVPDSPPESLDLNYWRLALFDSESAKSLSSENRNSSRWEGVKVMVPMEQSDAAQEVRVDTNSDEAESDPATREDELEEECDRYEKFLDVLNSEESLMNKRIVVEKIRMMLKDDEEARVSMGGMGFIEALVKFLQLAVQEKNQAAQEDGAMALFNVAVNNDRNKDLMLSAGVIPLLEDMILNPDSHELAAALYLNLSCLDEAKPILGPSKAVPFLVKLLLRASLNPQCKQDSLHSLFNLSTCPSNIPFLLESGIITALHSLLREPRQVVWTEKSIAVIGNLGASDVGREAIASAEGIICELAAILDLGEAAEQEQAASCLLILCSGSDRCIEMALQEGVIPSLVCLSVNGTPRGREKSQKLLTLFREQRHRDQSPPQVIQQDSIENAVEKMSILPLLNESESDLDPKPLVKSSSTSRRLGKTFSFFRKTRNHSSR